MNSTRRLVLILCALAAGLVALPGVASAAPGGFSLGKLRLNSTLGPENYLYTAGDTIHATGAVAAGQYHRFVVSDPSGTAVATSPCAAAPAGGGTVTNSFSVQSSSPVSNTTAWRYQLQRFAAAGCAGSPAETKQLHFAVAKATAYADSALTTPRKSFGAGQVAYVSVQGLAKVKGSATVGAVADWSTTWLLPFGTACANTANADRPDSTAGGLFPTGSGPLGSGGYLQYRPNVVAVGDAWNRESNYETKPCPDLGSGNQGQWRVTLKRDNSHFVTLPVFTVDTTVPDTNVSGGPAGPTNSTTATMQFASDSANATFQCRLDFGSWTSCTSPKSYSGLATGAHTFDVRSVDEAGNVDPTPATRSWSVDTSLPAVTLTAPADGVWTNDATPLFSGTGANGAGDSTTVVVKVYAGSTVSGSPVATLDAPRVGSSWSIASSSLADGTYTAFAQQSDNASNNGFSEQHTFKVDSTAPVVQLAAPVAGAATNDPAALLTGAGGALAGDDDEVTVEIYSGTSATGSPLQTMAATVAGGLWTTNAAPDLAEGTYTARAAQTDAAGNTGYSPAHVFTVDTTAPATTITAGPTGATAETTASFRFVSTEPGSTFECRIDGGTWGACTSPKAYFSVSAGAHTFDVRAIDRAGNVDDDPDSRAWTVNGNLPDVTLLTPADGGSTSDTTPAFSGDAGTAAGDSATITVKIYSLSSGSPVLAQTRSTTRASGAWTVDASPALAEGPYVAHAEQAGTAGTGSSAEHAFTVDTTAPNTTITLGLSGATSSTSATFEFGSSEEGSTFQCHLDAGAWEGCTSPRAYTGLAAGTHTFSVRALDAAGNVDSAPATATWTVDPSVPAVSISSPADGSYSSTGSPLVSGVGGTAVGDSLTVDVELYRDGVLITTVTAFRSSSDGTWSVLVSPGLDEGTYVARASQAGSSGTGFSAPRTFTVDATPPSTAITEGPTGSTTADTARFRFMSSETGSTFECRLDGGSWGACTSPVQYTGLSEGSHTFDVRAVDAAGNVDPFAASRTWLVDPTAPPVTLTAPADDSWTQDSTPSFSGFAGTSIEDDATVTVEIYDGTSLSDDPVLVLTTTRSSVDGSWSVVASPALADGTYVAFAAQSDTSGNTGYSAARTFSVDTTPAAVTLVGPADGSTGSDSTPLLFGAAGTAPGDSATVTVKVYSGTAATGTPVRTVTATATAGDWSGAVTSALADGTYTARAQQDDLAGNTGFSSPHTFTIATPAPPSGGGGGGGGGGGPAGSGAFGDLAISGSVSPDAAPVGNSLVWRFTIAYKGYYGLAPNVYADVAVPAGVTITTMQSDRGAGCQVVAGGNLHCDLDVLGVGGAVNVVLGSNVMAAGELRLTVTTGSKEADPAPEDNMLVLSANKPAQPPTAVPLTLKLQRPQAKTLLKKGKLLVNATCSQACTLKLTAKLRVKVNGKFRILKVTKTVTLPAAKRTTLQLTLTKKARAVVLRALERHQRVTVSLTGAATGPTGIASAKLGFSGKR